MVHVAASRAAMLPLWFTLLASRAVMLPLWFTLLASRPVMLPMLCTLLGSRVVLVFLHLLRVYKVEVNYMLMVNDHVLRRCH